MSHAIASRRLRMFAGPNGSGKTSLVRLIGREFNPDGIVRLGHFINADDILRDLQTGIGLNFDCLRRTVALDDVRIALRQGGRLDPAHPFLAKAAIQGNQLTSPSDALDAYVAASLADYLREQLLALDESFSYETVMSHESKVTFLAKAHQQGYRTYLYYVAIDSPEVNANRVQNRAMLGGHNVPEDKLIDRYYRSLSLIRSALPFCTRAYFFDNTEDAPIWFAERTPDGTMLTRTKYGPRWFCEWVVGKDMP